jgi:hypothetical protein
MSWGQVFTDPEGVRQERVTLPSLRSKVASGDLTPGLVAQGTGVGGGGGASGGVPGGSPCCGRV